MKKITKFEDTLKVRGRVPRKLKKELKKDKYFNLFGWMWIREIKWKQVRKAIETYWGYHIGRAESIQAPNL